MTKNLKIVAMVATRNEEDFIKSTISVYGSSVVEVGGDVVMKGKLEVK